MKKTLVVLMSVFLSLSLVSCDEILNFFQAQIKSIASFIEGVEVDDVQTGGMDSHFSEDVFRTLLKDNNIETGDGNVNEVQSTASGHMVSKDADTSIADIRYGEEIAVVYFYPNADNSFDEQYSKLAGDETTCSFYKFTNDKIPQEWIDDVNKFKSDDGKYTNGFNWTIRCVDGESKTEGDGVSFYILSNDRIQTVISGKTTVAKLKEEILPVKKMLSYRLKAKLMHWGAGYAIEDTMYEIKAQDGISADELFEKEVNFEIEKEAIRQYNEVHSNAKIDFDNKNHIALVLMYKSKPMPIVGENGSYRGEDCLMSAIAKSDKNDATGVYLRNIVIGGSDRDTGKTPYDMNLAQRHPDVKFIKCNGLGVYERKSTESSKSSLDAIGKILKRDYSSYYKTGSDTDIGYKWLIDQCWNSNLKSQVLTYTDENDKSTAALISGSGSVANPRNTDDLTNALWFVTINGRIWRIIGSYGPNSVKGLHYSYIVGLTPDNDGQTVDSYLTLAEKMTYDETAGKWVEK